MTQPSRMRSTRTRASFVESAMLKESPSPSQKSNSWYSGDAQGAAVGDLVLSEIRESRISSPLKRRSSEGRLNFVRRCLELIFWIEFVASSPGDDSRSCSAG